MDEPLDEQYLKWLYSHVASIRFKNPARTYWSLFKQLHSTEFVCFVPNDDNRVEDGRELRFEFINKNQINADKDWLDLGCSFLEMLLGLSRKLAFESDKLDSRGWFWELLGNLHLSDHTDLYYGRMTEQDVAEIINRVIHRTYEPDGYGGLFPMNGPCEDQRKVELWYQLNKYLLERV